jgi:hypothetical protein
MQALQRFARVPRALRADQPLERFALLDGEVVVMHGPYASAPARPSLDLHQYPIAAAL